MPPELAGTDVKTVSGDVTDFAVPCVVPVAVAVTGVPRPLPLPVFAKVFMSLAVALL